ncbi:MAG: DUF1559 domain-containing protein [Candidatus Omnitrophica bacterium]|nr:DUF1559 domain-containing protein [Candidatus Omnitrophota bacterium]
MMINKDGHRRKSFSLIELLVTVAIVTLLLAFTTSGIRRVRCSSMMAQCMSNIRQLGIAILMYEQDYDALPGSLAEIGPYKRSYYAKSSRSKHLFAIKAAHAQYPPLGPYYQNYYEDENEALQKVRLLQCPVVPLGNISYGINENIAGRSIRSITNKSCIIMSDSTSLIIHQIADVSFRHCSENSANVMFVDMTVHPLSAGEFSENMLNPDDTITVQGTWGYWTGRYLATPELIVYGNSLLDPISSPYDLATTGPNIDYWDNRIPGANVERITCDKDGGGLSTEADPIYITGIWEWIATDTPPWEQ